MENLKIFLSLIPAQNKDTDETDDNDLEVINFINTNYKSIILNVNMKLTRNVFYKELLLKEYYKKIKF